MTTEAKVSQHYTRGRLEQSILNAVTQSGKDPAHLTAADLATVDEFHLGGLEATQELAAQMNLQPGLHLLDVGSGIGGPARYFASEHACKVTGIDLTEEFIQVAKSLTQLVKLDPSVDFRQASALALPFPPATFDRAYMIHVGMNIADKLAIFREVRRVLKPGGLFAIFDIMRSADGPLLYPVPWALTDETSFVTDAKNYLDALTHAGFTVTHQRGRRDFAIEFTRRTLASVAQGGPPTLGLHLLMGEKTPLMIQNVLTMLQANLLEPIELVARAV
jgi:SAM-dependent methyltransferase